MKTEDLVSLFSTGELGRARVALERQGPEDIVVCSRCYAGTA
jgi:hypothetical protein